MTVTKQQQLEWLVNKADAWGDDRTIGYMMSRDEVGFVVGLLTRLTDIELLAGHSHIITREEWQQERDKMSSKPEVDNSWHERGELPPVGCECWHILEGRQVFIVAKHCSIDAVIFSSDPGAGELFYGYDSDFRPIRTERENAIDDISSYFCDADGFQVTPHATDLIAARIYDAGYRKAKS